MTDTGFMYRRYRFSGLDTPSLFPGNVQEILWGVFIEHEMIYLSVYSRNPEIQGLGMFGATNFFEEIISP